MIKYIFVKSFVDKETISNKNLFIIEFLYYNPITIHASLQSISTDPLRRCPN